MEQIAKGHENLWNEVLDRQPNARKTLQESSRKN